MEPYSVVCVVIRCPHTLCMCIHVFCTVVYTILTHTNLYTIKISCLHALCVHVVLYGWCVSYYTCLSSHSMETLHWWQQPTWVGLKWLWSWWRLTVGPAEYSMSLPNFTWCTGTIHVHVHTSSLVVKLKVILVSQYMYIVHVHVHVILIHCMYMSKRTWYFSISFPLTYYRCLVHVYAVLPLLIFSYPSSMIRNP